MIRALFSAASGMNAQQTNIENIANNLANSNTTGYKARRAQFQDLLYQTMQAPGTQASAQTFVPAGLQLGMGTRASSNYAFPVTSSRLLVTAAGSAGVVVLAALQGGVSS